MESSIKHCIINANTGNGWYPVGTERLKRSLIYHGFNGDILTWNDWPNNEFNKECPYNIKAAAFTEAIKLGYTRILWLDSSVWAISDPNKIFDIINSEGYYFWKSGYNCAQIASDKSLKYFAVDRNKAESFEDCSSSMLGVNLSNPEGERFISKWIRAAKDGAFEGSRLHDNQSSDKRFLFHRQDQTAASLIIGKMGLKMYEPGVYSSYYQKEINESIIFLMRGI